nr:pyridoxamine kinase [uncultured Blautia sp.]
MKKIAVLNDLSGLGKCSLTAAIPVISAMGVQACPLPTAVLSNQTGYASYYCDDYTQHMDAIMDEWEKRDFHPDGIYTGFLAGEKQADKILEFIRRFSSADTRILVDPVMGDQGRAYDIYSDQLCEKMRILAAKAQVITPNLTEALLLLYGKEEMEKKWVSLQQLSGEAYLKEIEKLGSMLHEQYQVPGIVITGVDYQEGTGWQMGNLIWEKGKETWVFSQKTGGSYSGTGDLFASVLCGGMVQGICVETLVHKAVRFLGKAILDAVQEGTDRNDGVCFEKYLYTLWED